MPEPRHAVRPTQRRPTSWRMRSRSRLGSSRSIRDGSRKRPSIDVDPRTTRCWGSGSNGAENAFRATLIQKGLGLIHPLGTVAHAQVRPDPLLQFSCIDLDPPEDGAVVHPHTTSLQHYQRIAYRSFKQTFNLADHVKVTKANLEHGLLSVELAREIPEQLKPRRIEIGSPAVALPGQDNQPKLAEQGQAA